MVRPVRDAPAPRTGSLIAFSLVFLLGLLSFGTYLNDEGAQLTALHNLRQGHLTLDEGAPQFYAVTDGILLPAWNTTQPIQSPFVSFSALPAYFLLKALDSLWAPPTLLLLAWAASTYIAATRLWSRAYAWRTGMEWDWYTKPISGENRRARLQQRLSSMTLAHHVLVGVLALFTFLQWFQQAPVDYDTYGEVFAIQTTTVALTAGAFVLFHRIALGELGSARVANLAALAFLSSPVLFWGMGVKYHGASVVLTVAAVYLYRSESPWRYAAFAVAGLGIWNTILAAPLLVALVIMEILRLGMQARRRGVRSIARPAAWVVASLLAGLTVVLAYNQWAWNNWLGRRGLRDEAMSGGVLSALYAAWDWAVTMSRFESVGISLRNVYAVLIDGSSIQGRPVALLPLIALSPLAFLAPMRIWKDRMFTRTIGLSLLFIAGFTMVFIHGAHTQGAGDDPRFFVGTIPFIVLLAAVAIQPWLDGVDGEALRAGFRTYAIGAPVVLFSLAILGTNGVAFDEAQPIAQLKIASTGIGMAVALALLVLHFRPTLVGNPDLTKMRLVGLSFIAPSIWLFMMTIMVYRYLAPWPFGTGGEGFSFLLPSLDDVRRWWGPKLIP